MRRLLFPVFNLSRYPFSGVTMPSKLKEWRMPIRSWQNEGRRGTKADGICDLTYQNNDTSKAKKYNNNDNKYNKIKDKHTHTQWCGDERKIEKNKFVHMFHSHKQEVYLQWNTCICRQSEVNFLFPHLLNHEYPMPIWYIIESIIVKSHRRSDRGWKWE